MMRIALLAALSPILVGGPKVEKIDMVTIAKTGMGEMDALLGKASTVRNPDTNRDVPPDNAQRTYKRPHWTIVMFAPTGNRDPKVPPRSVAFRFDSVRSWKDCAKAAGLSPTKAIVKKVPFERGKTEQYTWKELPKWEAYYMKWSKGCQLQFSKQSK